LASFLKAYISAPFADDWPLLNAPARDIDCLSSIPGSDIECAEIAKMLHVFFKTPKRLLG